MDKYFLPALLLTISIETALLFPALRIFAKGERQPVARILFAGLLASFATLPYLWFVLPLYLKHRYYLWIGEAGVTLIEMVILRQLLSLNWKQAFLISQACNLVSFLLGGYVLAHFT